MKPLPAELSRRPFQDNDTETQVRTATSADGVTIAYEVYGTGEPAFVLVHGWSCDRRYWYGQVELLARNFMVVTVDLGGHGMSGFGRENWTTASFGDDVAAVVKELDLEHVILLGHSMGGSVTLEAARRIKDRVDMIIWIDTYHRIGVKRTPEEVYESMAAFREDFRNSTRALARSMFLPTSSRALIDWVTEDMVSAPPAVGVSAMENAILYGREIPRVLTELNLPLITINAATPPTDMKSMERYGIKVYLLEGVGHFPMLEAPERFNQLLTNVIDENIRT